MHDRPIDRMNHEELNTWIELLTRQHVHYGNYKYENAKAKVGETLQEAKRERAKRLMEAYAPVDERGEGNFPHPH